MKTKRFSKSILAASTAFAMLLGGTGAMAAEEQFSTTLSGENVYGYYGESGKLNSWNKTVNPMQNISVNNNFNNRCDYYTDEIGTTGSQNAFKFWYYLGSIDLNSTIENVESIEINGILGDTNRNWMKICITNMAPDELKDAEFNDTIRITRKDDDFVGDIKYSIRVDENGATLYTCGAEETELVEYKTRDDIVFNTSTDGEGLLLPENLEALKNAGADGKIYIYGRARYNGSISVTKKGTTDTSNVIKLRHSPN